ncbi:serine/threonine-protein kinase [Rhodopirellula sallentina]|uniref:Serine/threonine protein kinase n=1 Tax=Rhodopirellula sallentina SM41 TaxID=1263870 RepID=M5TW97_9BACT|nr:serine/threonine-protein kinase [Rhodopirellula sallentina]EMI53450.1 serine/threonine protein kinase [Rhodopirellula sallentina SM41]
MRTSIAGLEGGDRVGNYVLLERIGEGGMGTVFRAEQVEPFRRLVALKVIKTGMDSRRVITRFEVERQTLALMDHQNIAQVFDAGTTEAGLPYFVMELVNGEPITRYCDGKQLTLRQRLQFFVPVCRAIQHAHQKGIIHRDIKPSNVLVGLYDGKPVPKVIDFGVAKATQSNSPKRTALTELGQIVGTPEYISPEQAELNPFDIDTRSDIYSLGVLLYELLTGTTPILKEDMRKLGLVELLHQIRELEPPKPSTRVSQLDTQANQSGEPVSTLSRANMSSTRGSESAKFSRMLRGDLDWVVMKALEKDRSRRYETAEGFAADVEQYLDGGTVTARPPSTYYTFCKYAGRNKSLITMVLSIAVVLLMASMLSTWSAIRASDAERLAESRLAIAEQERNEKEQALERAVANQRRAEDARIEADARRREFEVKRNEAVWNQYVARLYPIIDAWEARDFGHLQQRLEELVPRKDEPDVRGWEWAYFKDQCDQAVLSIAGEHAAFHPWRDAVAVVAKGDDSNWCIELRSARDASFIRRLVTLSGPQAKEARNLRWSADASRLAYSTSDGRAVVVDVASGTKIFEVNVHADQASHIVRAFDLSGDGKILVTGNFFGFIALWDIDSGERLQVLHDPKQRSNLQSVSLSPDSTHLVGGLRYGRRTTWRLADAARFEYAPQSLKYASVCWHPAGKRFAATDADSFPVFEINKKDPVATLEHPKVSTISFVGEDRLVSAGRDQVIRIWDANSFELQEERRVLRVPAHEIHAGHQSPLVAASADGLVQVIDVEASVSKHDVLREPGTPEQKCNLVSWSRDGAYLAVGYVDGASSAKYSSRLLVWDLDAGRTVVNETFAKNVRMTFSWKSDEETLRVVTSDGRNMMYDLANESSAVHEPRATSLRIVGSSLSPNGKKLVIRSIPDGAVVADAETLQQLAKIETGEHVVSVQWSPDGSRVATGTYGFLDAWDESGKRIFRHRFPSPEQLDCIAWHPNAWLIAGGMSDGRVAILNADSGKAVLHLTGHTGPVTSLDWSSDGRRLATASVDGSVRVWDANTGVELLKLQHADEVAFRTVQWSRDSRRLAAGDDRGNVFVWGSADVPSLLAGAMGLASGKIAKAIAAVRRSRD